MTTLYLLSVWLHILAAVVWLGGIFFLVLVLVPVMRKEPDERRKALFLYAVGEQFRRISWTALGLIFVSGIFNLAYRGFGLSDVWNGRLWQGPFGRAFAVKFTLFILVIILSALHDFVIGPKSTRLWEERPDDPRVLRLRRQAGWIGRITMVLALLIVLMAVMMVRGWPGFR